VRESEEPLSSCCEHRSSDHLDVGLDKLCNYCNRPWLESLGRSLEAELATAGRRGPPR